MKKLSAGGLFFGFLASVAGASNLDLSVQQSNGTNEITVPSGGIVNYQVVGALTDGDNEGLALIGFDLCACVPLSQADTPTTEPMVNFAPNLGISNPAGYGGTPADNGCLLQIGGGQNTIRNDPAVTNAPFPSGAVLTDVAKPGSMYPAPVIVTGSFAVPEVTVPTRCDVTLTNAFANAIKAGETGEIFFKTEQAGINQITNLTVNVIPEDCQRTIDPAESIPAGGSVDARQPNDIDGSNPSGWRSFDLRMTGGDLECLETGSFEVTTTNRGTLGVESVTPIGGGLVRVTLTDRIPVGEWTRISHNDTHYCVGFLPADVIGDGTSNSFDLLRLIDCLNRVATCQIHQCDVNRTGECNSQDILREVDLLNPIPALGGPWNGRTLGPSPCQ